MIVIVSSSAASATELRIVDQVGLVRAVKLVKGPATVTIDGVSAGARCTAVSVDGIAGERSVEGTPAGQCSFPQLPPGTWQIAVTPGSRWKVRIDG